MKIIGGSMGFGSAKLSSDGKLRIDGTTIASYDKEHIKDLDMETIKQKKFGIIGFILGSLILGTIGAVFLGVIGLVVAVVICVFGSFYSVTHYQLRLSMTDGNKVTLQASKSEAERAAVALR